MRTQRMAWLLIFAGTVLLLSPAILGKAVTAEMKEVNGVYSVNKAVVSVKNQLGQPGSSSFSENDMKKISKKLKTDDLAYIARSGLVSTSVNNGNTPYPADITGTNHLYDRFYGMKFESGGYFTKKAEEDGSAVAVIDDKLAWNMFRTRNVVGKTLQIFGTTFRIVGVIKKDGSLLQRLTDDGRSDVYIPAGKLLELDNTSLITAFEVRTEDTSTLDKNKDLVSSALQAAGKNPSNYIITDYNISSALMAQKPGIAAFIAGFLAILYLAAFIARSLLGMYKELRDGCSSDYLSNVIRSNATRIIGSALEILAAVAFAVLIWELTRFRLYIPPSYIPGELTDVSHFINLFKSSIQTGLSNLGYVAPHIELLMNKAGAVMNWIFYIPVFLGFILSYYGFAQIRHNSAGIERMTIYCGLITVVSIGVLAFTAYLTGLPFAVSAEGILAVWAFIFIKILKNNHRRESDVLNV